MSAGSFLCSICLDVFMDPVSTSCGHNFCLSCISRHWDTNISYSCPVCKETFNQRPQLRVNTFIRELVDQFRRELQQRSCSSEEVAAGPGEVPCDVCSGTRLKALKSCLVCLLSYCETHLEPHLTASRLRRHQLVEPVENLEDRMCTKHDRPLELFCQTDQTCICSICSVSHHKTHQTSPLREGHEGMKVEMEKLDAELQLMVQRRRLKIQEIREALKVSEDAADREKAEGVQVFSDLKESVERRLKELMKEVEDRMKAAEKQAEGLIKDLEQEICELKRRSSEVEQLSRSEDHLHSLQRFSFLKATLPAEDQRNISVRLASLEGRVVRAVDQLEKTLRAQTKLLVEAELKKVRCYMVDVTLDPETANPWLVLSQDRRRVHCGDVEQNLPGSPARFSKCVNVLGEQSFSSGRFYFEVRVGGKTDWDLGVARESVSRGDMVTLRPQDGFWTIWMRNGEDYEALDAPSVRLSLQPAPEKVGVFVDYEGGLVSFYNVDAAALIYSFTDCSFSEDLRLFFSPGLHEGGQNSAPLIISPVTPTSGP